MPAKPKPIPRHAAPTPLLSLDPTASEQWYLECLRAWCRSTGRAPTIGELATWIERSNMPTWTALASLEAKGWVTRASGRRFIPCEFQGLVR